MFTTYGSYYGNDTLDTGQFIKLDDPASPGNYVDYLTWGYSARTPPTSGIWIQSENLRGSSYAVPTGATAVRVHIKAKAKTITWTTIDVVGDLQVGIRPAGYSGSVNEVAHAYAGQLANTGQPVEQIAHVPVDVPLPSSGRIEFFAYPTVINSYANVELVAFLAGYYN